MCTNNSEYELLGDYYVPWKLIPEGKSGKVKAKITSGSIDADKVVFKTPTGTEYTANYNGSEFEITIVGSEHGDAQEIFALYQENDSTTKSLGKLKTASYNIIKGKLAIVPVGDAELSAETIKTQLDDIYLPYGIEWEVRSEPKFTNMGWAGDDQKLDAGESGFFSAYTAEMKALNKAFKAERTVNDDEVYLFVFNTEAANVESGVLLGDMPIGYQFGYLFSPSDDPITAKTIAHELAHGKLQLKHTFDASYGLDEGTTANLMDYSSGEQLVKQQWDAIFDPQILIAGFLQDDEDGAMKKLDSTYYFIIDGDTNRYYANSIIYHVRTNKQIKIKLHSDSTSIGKWEFKENVVANNTDSCKVNINNKGKDKLVVKLPNDQEVSITLKIYEPPVTYFFRGTAPYDGEYGFDNFYENHKVLKDSGNYEVLNINAADYHVPFMSLYPGQSEDIVMKVKITSDMLKDKMFKLILKDSLGVTATANLANIVKGQNSFNISVTSNNAFLNNRPVEIKDYMGSILGRLNVRSENPTNRRIKVIYVKSDTLPRVLNLAAIQNQLNNFSYNQVFANWSIIPLIDTVDVAAVFTARPNMLNSSAMTLGYIVSKYNQDFGVDVINNPGADYYMFISNLTVNASNLEDGSTGIVPGRAADAPSHALGVFTGVTPDTYSHELGHCLGLFHTWTILNNKISKNSTENFMDYSSTRNYFWYWQWLIIKSNL